jgi:hypothetical protein
VSEQRADRIARGVVQMIARSPSQPVRKQHQTYEKCDEQCQNEELDEAESYRAAKSRHAQV